MKAKKHLPLYQRYRESGSLLHNRSGVEASLKEGDDATAKEVTWNVVAASLGGLSPLAGDFMRDTSGRWWEIVTVGAEVGGESPCACKPWKEGDK